MPVVTPPFGMTNWTAQTRQNKISVTSYNYDDATISGFIGTHQPAIWMGDYGYVTLMPQVGEVRTSPEGRKMAYSHKSETARPDYYAVTLGSIPTSGERPPDMGHPIRVEMTATERCSYLRMRFPKVGVARVLMEASRPGVAGFAAVDVKRGEMTGWNPHRMDAHLGPYALPNFKGYFVVEFRQDAGSGAIAGKTWGMEDAGAAGSRGAYAEFAPGAIVEMRVGTSFLSVEDARANLRREIPAWGFEAVQQKLRAVWDEKLDRLQVTGATDKEKTRLYTAMYHTLLHPREFSEGGRYYSAFDDKVHTGESYTAFSIWGHVSGGEQLADAGRSGACGWDDYGAAAEF